MTLRCQFKGPKCPPYAHKGVFEADNATLIRFEADLKRCAKCTANAAPALPSFQDDLLQIARITLWKKGPGFKPDNIQGACFRTYMLPRICGALTRAKKTEQQHLQRFTPAFSANDFLQEGVETSAQVQDNFVDALIWEMWNTDFERALPQLEDCLTSREQQVFTCIRANMKQRNIAEALALSKPRVNQLLKQVERKLIQACQTLGLIG